MGTFLRLLKYWLSVDAFAEPQTKAAAEIYNF
jgi:hypothetical protein